MYDGKKLIPSPFMEISKEKQKSEDGTTRRVVYVITLTGKLTSDRGSPLAKVTGYPDGSFWTASGYPPNTDTAIAVDIDNRLQLLAIKKGAICELFCKDGLWFESQPYNGTASVKFLPKIRNIQWNTGNWVNYIDYTITMETDQIDFAGTICCAQAGDDSEVDPVEETWAIEQSDEVGRTYRLTHQVSAQQKKSFKSDGSGDVLYEGWEIAKGLVLTRLGISVPIKNAPDVLDLDDFNAYNYIRGETIDEPNGRFGVSETWLLYKPDEGTIGCIEDFTVNTRISVQDDLTTVTIDGTLKGLEERDNTTRELITNRYTNALAKWAVVRPGLLNRAQLYSDIDMNPIPLNAVMGQQPFNGIITYSYEYNNRAGLITGGALSESISVSDRLPSDVFAKIPVMVRPLGPVFQDIGSNTDKARTLSIEIVVPAAKYPATAVSRPDPSTFITTYGPGGSDGFTATEGPFIEQNTVNWQPQSGRYSRVITWTYN